MSRGVRWAETTRTSWADVEPLEHVDGPLHDGQVRRAAHDDGDQRCRAAHRSTPAGRSMPSGTGVPRARAADQARGAHLVGVVATHRHVPQFASRPGAACHTGGRGRPPRPARGRAAGPDRRPSGPPKTLTLATWGCWGAVDPSGQVEHGPHVVLELGGHRALHRPVARVVGPGRHLVDQQPAPGPEELHGHDADGPGDLGHLLAERRGRLEHVGVQPARHEHLPADAAHLGRLDRRPGHRRARRAAGHHDGQLGVERQQFLHDDLPGHAGQHRAPPRPGRPRATRPCRRSRPGPP